MVSDLESQITEKDEEISQLQDTLSETQEQVDTLQGDLDSALEQNQALSGSDAQKKADFLDSYYLSWDSDIMDDVVTCHKFNCKHLPENEALLLIPSYFILVEGYELCPDCCF